MKTTQTRLVSVKIIMTSMRKMLGTNLMGLMHVILSASQLERFLRLQLAKDHRGKILYTKLVQMHWELTNLTESPQTFQALYSFFKLYFTLFTTKTKIKLCKLNKTKNRT